MSAIRVYHFLSANHALAHRTSRHTSPEGTLFLSFDPAGLETKIARWGNSYCGETIDAAIESSRKKGSNCTLLRRSDRCRAKLSLFRAPTFPLRD
jgi:hypothetical protein